MPPSDKIDAADRAAAGEIVYHGVRLPPHRQYLPERRIERIRNGRYEWQEIAGALHAIRPGDRVLELGAGIGIVGAVIAKNRAPARILSYEANPALIGYARAMHRANGLGEVIELRNAVLMSDPDAPATTDFHVHASFLGSSLIAPAGRRSTRVAVAVERLAAVTADFSPEVMVIDIEGGELAFFRHADLSKLRAVIVELHPKVYGQDGLAECLALLHSAGLARIEAVSHPTVVAYARPAAGSATGPAAGAAG